MGFSYPVTPSGITTKFVDEQTIATTLKLLSSENNWKRPIVSISEMLKCENRCILEEIKYCFFLQIRIYNNKPPKSSATQELTSFSELHPIVSIPVQAFTNLGQCIKKGLGLRGKRTGFSVWRPESDSQPCGFSDELLQGSSHYSLGKYLIPRVLGGGLMYAKAL